MCVLFVQLLNETLYIFIDIVIGADFVLRMYERFAEGEVFSFSASE